jgi:hypothetical protein
MATNLPTDIAATYPDASPGDATHQAHHDESHAYTNSHDTAVDPHGDRAYADATFARPAPHLDVSGGGFAIPRVTFATIPFGTVNYDSANGWDAVAYEYVVPEDGVYLLTGLLRVADATPPGTQYGVGAHKSNVDGSHFMWHAVQDTLNASDRTTYPYARQARFVTGDRVRMFTWHDHTADLTFNAAALQVTRLETY